MPARDNTDEIGEMAKGRRGVQTRRRLPNHELEEQQAREQAVQARRQEEVGQLVGFFGPQRRSRVYHAGGNLGRPMTESSSNAGGSASEADSQARVVLGRGGTDRLQRGRPWSSAAQQLSASIAGDRSIGPASWRRISTEAMQQPRQVVSKVVRNCAAAAEQIGTVIDLISNIAGSD